MINSRIVEIQAYFVKMPFQCLIRHKQKVEDMENAGLVRVSGISHNLI